MLHTALDTLQLAGGIAPPGADKVNLIAAWVLWIAAVALVSAVVIAGLKIAFSGHGRGGGGEHGMALLMALAGAVVCGVAGTIVSQLGVT